MVWYSYTPFYLRRGDLGSWKPPSGWGGGGGGWLEKVSCKRGRDAEVHWVGKMAE